MEQSIPALVVAAVMIVAGVLIASVTNNSVETVNESWREMERIAESRLGTDLTVLSTSVAPDGTQVTAVVRNEGRTQLYDFEHMDLIVNYDGADLQRHNVWLPYSEEVPQPANTWTVSAIAGDFHNPGILDTGEEMTLTILLDPATVAGSDRWLVLATDTGVSYTVYF
jgi:archaellum component FlaF (FlaF/FlaG flagellin family)